MEFDTIVHCKYYAQHELNVVNPTVIDVVLADNRVVTTDKEVNMTLVGMSPNAIYCILRY